tara:strand:+ start:525 stop:1283 length:759 start_codon:yes stop_codon:yes gene_type:complete
MEQIDINEDAPVDPSIQPVENTTEVVTDDQPLNRPEWLPEKFQSPEAMAEAYEQLERRLSQGTEPLEETASIQDLQATAKGVTSESLTKYTQEFVEKGELSEESYADLASHGVDKTAVDSYISGQRALIEQNLQSVYTEVGGQEAYGQLIEWATRNLPEADINTFNESVQTLNPDGTLDMQKAMFAIRGLKAQHGAAEGRQPQLLQGTAGAATGNAYKSTAQVIAAMQDKRYELDPAYRQEVQDKLAVSSVF